MNDPLFQPHILDRLLTRAARRERRRVNWRAFWQRLLTGKCHYAPRRLRPPQPQESPPFSKKDLRKLWKRARALRQGYQAMRKRVEVYDETGQSIGIKGNKGPS